MKKNTQVGAYVSPECEMLQVEVRSHVLNNVSLPTVSVGGDEEGEDW